VASILNSGRLLEVAIWAAVVHQNPLPLQSVLLSFLGLGKTVLPELGPTAELADRCEASVADSREEVATPSKDRSTVRVFRPGHQHGAAADRRLLGRR